MSCCDGYGQQQANESRRRKQILGYKLETMILTCFSTTMRKEKTAEAFKIIFSKTLHQNTWIEAMMNY
jgi:hypothetical protein